MGAAYAVDGTLVSQTYCFGDTFEMHLTATGGSAGLAGYGITNAEQNVTPVLRKLLQFIEANHKVQRRETKGF